MSYVQLTGEDMAKRGDPSVLRLVVSFLRDHAQMTQARFGKECRVAQAEMSKYELGQVAPSEEALRRMAKVARIDWPLVAHLRQFYSSLLGAAASGHSIRDVKPLDVMLLEPVRLAVASYLIETTQPAQPGGPSSADGSCDEAEQIWKALEKHPSRFRQRLIELSPRSGSWALAVRACEESLKRAAHKAGEALELAELALSIAERSPGNEGRRSRLEGYCWAHIANARRVGNDQSGAEEAFTRAWDFWRMDACSEPDLLPEWRLFALEASLRRDQRRLSEALKLLEQAKGAAAGDPIAFGRILLKKENVLLLMGNSRNALVTLVEAAPFVEASGDDRLLLALRFKMVNNLCHLERHAEAAELLPQVRALAIQQANELDLVRVRWLTSRVAAGQGRTEEAVAALEEVRADFTVRGLPYDAALSSLDLAVLWLQAGRTADVRDLAIAMGWIFKANGIHREALAALGLFYEAALQEAATEELARRVIAEMRRLTASSC
jgi:transcriptional regulator with XRE-family HTH domain/tetratricopeptide (TPR) repeat protein